MSPLKRSASAHRHHELDDSSTNSVVDVFSNEKSFDNSNFSGDNGILPIDMFPEDDASFDSSCCFGSEAILPEPTLEEEQEERDIFEKARQYLHPGPLLRYAIYLFGERKLLTFFGVHFMCTMVIFAHFFLIKFDQKAAAVPEGAPYYWWKRIVPSLEFGTMHSVLFQMALIPLTMARFSIASLSESAVNSLVPLNRMMRIHIHLGYTICILLVLSTILFFVFFGLLCAKGEEEICAKFTSEIMCTGYGIFATILILLGTSYFRRQIPYEVFYGIHHLVFIFYAITIAHTLDNKQRNHEEQRSQTFKWFSATLLYYFCDRAAMYINHRYKAPLVSSSTIEGSNGSRMVLLRLRRPPLFSFKPGQYAYLRVSSIDPQWHPFSIASGPASSYLEFYCEVFKEGSWTDQLWGLLKGTGDGGCFSHRQIDVDIMGPCGTSLATTENYSEALVIGTGTGIVPILSLYKQHVRQLLRLDPWSHFSDLENHRRKILAAEKAFASRKGSLARKMVGACAPLCQRQHDILDTATSAAVGPNDSLAFSIRDKIERHARQMRWRDVKNSIKDMKSQAFQATQSIYGVVVLAILTAVGTLLIGMTISVNTTSANRRDEMIISLEVCSAAFHLIYAGVALCVWDGNQIFAFTDAALCLIAPFADWYWSLQYHNNENGKLTSGDITTYCLLTGYMTARLWGQTVKPHHKSWRKSIASDAIDAMDGLDLVWVSRSASLVSELMPDINHTWDMLAAQWGKEHASRACRISIYVTDKDENECDLLRRELSSTKLFQDGAIQFGRPDFAKLIEDHTIRMICTRKKSCSLLAFCGSQDVAEEIHHHKVSNDMVTAITGHNNAHQMEFVHESYGGQKREKEVQRSKKDEKTEQVRGENLTTRTVVSYCPTSTRKFVV